MYHQTFWNGAPDNVNPQWHNLAGIFVSAPAAVSWSNGRVDVFGLGLDRAMYHKSWNGAAWPTDWERLGGIFTSAASVVSWGLTSLIFSRGSDFTLRHRAYDGTTWLNEWQNLGGSLASPPTAVSWGPNRLDVFAIGKDGMLIHRWWDGDDLE
jgi:sialidase-1